MYRSLSIYIYACDTIFWSQIEYMWEFFSEDNVSMFEAFFENKLNMWEKNTSFVFVVWVVDVFWV